MNPSHVSLEKREVPSHVPMFENGIPISASFSSMPQSKRFELQMIPKKKFKLSRMGESWGVEFNNLHAALEYAKSQLGGESGELIVKSKIGGRLISLKL